MQSPATSNDLGQRIRRAREREGLTQVALALKLGVTAMTISNWEKKGLQNNNRRMKELESVLGNLSEGAPGVSGMHDEQVPITPDNEVSSFGIWIRDQRIKASMSVPELANLATISAVALYNIESGKIQNPQVATINKLGNALKKAVPEVVVTETEHEQSIVGLGNLTDFDPYSRPNWPSCPGVYVLYDISQRPIYVGKATSNISIRLGHHFDKFWFRDPVVRYGSYIEVQDRTLCHQLEQAMIKFLKSNAVINKQSVEEFNDE